MSIHEELGAELRDAMKARDRARMDVIRQVETEVARARSEPGFSGAVDDTLYRAVISSYRKKMEKAREEFRAAGERGAVQAAKLGFEIDYLARWLPPDLPEEETRRLVAEAIAAIEPAGPKEAGKVVGHIMKAGHAGIDGKLVNELVRQALGTE